MSEATEIQPGMHPKLAAAFVAAFAEMPHAQNNAQNSHIGNRYADLREVLDTVRPVLKRHDLAVSQMPGDVLVLPDGAGVMVSVTTVLMHASGHVVQFRTQVLVAPERRKNKQTGAMEPELPGAQAVGKGTTYAKRYALSALFGFASEDDDGNAASGRAGDDDPVTRAQVATDRVTFDGVKEQALAKIAACATKDALKELKALVQDLGDQAVAKAYVAKRAELDAAAVPAPTEPAAEPAAKKGKK